MRIKANYQGANPCHLISCRLRKTPDSKFTDPGWTNLQLAYIIGDLPHCWDPQGTEEAVRKRTETRLVCILVMQRHGMQVYEVYGYEPVRTPMPHRGCFIASCH